MKGETKFTEKDYDFNQKKGNAFFMITRHCEPCRLQFVGLTSNRIKFNFYKLDRYNPFLYL